MIKSLSFIIATLPILLITPIVVSAASDNASFPEAGAVDKASGLEAWSRIYEVASHPRCSNCHVGSSDRPMWSGPSYGETRPHGMKVRAGRSRIGAEFIACDTCHAASKFPQTEPHAAPRVAGTWRLAPAGAGWFGRSGEYICAQLRDPKRNGGMDYKALANHAGHDVVLQWAWNPGPGREPAPYSLQKHIMDLHTWGAAGQPCPQD